MPQSTPAVRRRLVAVPAPDGPEAQPLRGETIRALGGAVEDLAGSFELQPLLERILHRAVDLLGGAAGSICTVDEANGTYRKEADLGVSCRQGSVFPLDEGSTGAVVTERGPVVFAEYAHVPSGHLTAEERDRLHATVAVPIEWSGEIIGACVVFSDDPAKSWTQREVDLLQLFAGHAAVALVNARQYAAAVERARRLAVAEDRERALRDVQATLIQTLSPVFEHLDSLGQNPASKADRQHLSAVAEATGEALAATRRALGGGGAALTMTSLDDAVRQELAWLRATSDLQTDLVVAGDLSGIAPDVARPALHAVQESLANVRAHSDATQVRVGVLRSGNSVNVLISDNGTGFVASASPHGGITRALDIVERAGGTVNIETLPSWGTRIRIELPDLPAPARDNGSATLRVLVVDPRPLVRAGVARLLSDAQPELRVVAKLSGGGNSRAADGDADRVARSIHAMHPDVVLIGVSGLPATPEHRRESLVERTMAAAPGTTLLALCDQPLTHDQQAFLAQHGCGAVGLDASAAELSRAVRAAASGVVQFGARSVSADALETSVSGATLLTERELQVVELIGRGMPDKQAARALGISVKTVEKHVGSALRKTGQPNRTALAAQLSRR